MVKRRNRRTWARMRKDSSSRRCRAGRIRWMRKHDKPTATTE